jgi:integration host factor subunit alpha
MNSSELDVLSAEQHGASEREALGYANGVSQGDTPTLTKAELAELLFERVGLNKRESKDMVDAFFDVIRDALQGGESVKLSGFGNFQLRDKPQRPGRNPKTGEAIPIAARRVVTFHASQKLKAFVESGAPDSSFFG